MIICSGAFYSHPVFIPLSAIWMDHVMIIYFLIAALVYMFGSDPDSFTCVSSSTEFYMKSIIKRKLSVRLTEAHVNKLFF